MADKKEDHGHISYILGIVSIVLAFFTPVAGLILGIIGLIHGNKSNSGLAAKGKKLSKIGIVVSIIITIAMIIVGIYTGLSSLESLNLSG
jgi:heme/copper-type cytochrome/quinol oxidase subunit 2